jgi:hypothetical protein
MNHALPYRLAAFVTAVLVIAPAIQAKDSSTQGGASEAQARVAAIQAVIQANTLEAKALLKRSSDFLAAQQQFSFAAQTGFDVVQSNGQHLAFFETKKALLRRPDRLRVETDEADGDVRTFRFDGKQLSVDLPNDKAYVLVAKPGTVDEMLDYFVDDLGIPVPLNEFFLSNFYDEKQGAIESGFYVDEVTIGKRQCHHLAFRLDDVDIQFWIEDGDRPLPCSLVITYKLAVGAPQYWARFDHWDLSPRASDEQFEFVPPKGAERLSIQAAVAGIRDETEVK